MTEKSTINSGAKGTWIFGLLTTLPFWVLAYLIYRPGSVLSSVEAVTIAIVYGSAYLSFVAGSKWGLIGAGLIGTRSIAKLALATIGFLAGFVANFSEPAIGLPILIGGFVLFAFWDLKDSHAAIVKFWYAKFRIWLTIFTLAPLVAIFMKVL